MKTIMEFNLPEDQEEFNLTINATKYYCVLWDLNQYLRSTIKYQELSEEKEVIYQELRNKLWELLEEQGLSL